MVVILWTYLYWCRYTITSEPFLSQRIEVLKGPSTLLYGGGTIGGAINVIDSKIPMSVPEKGYEGELHYQYDSVSKGNTGSVGLTLGENNLALRLEGTNVIKVITNNQNLYIKEKLAV
ncbi:TonB-dependent receptor plug domain-containing protein [Morganella morganii]|uniref:TonB-dependent receptor plug domain-containing protein n=1 Tax=Morganella morganii TaxID=582 RepID=UPI001D0FF5E3|nr:TonB-dependent receptor plug domain-containing protein [Morganella morganii]